MDDMKVSHCVRQHTGDLWLVTMNDIYVQNMPQWLKLTRECFRPVFSKDKVKHTNAPMHEGYTVEPLQFGHHWCHLKCSEERGVPTLEASGIFPVGMAMRTRAI